MILNRSNSKKSVKNKSHQDNFQHQIKDYKSATQNKLCKNDKVKGKIQRSKPILKSIKVVKKNQILQQRVQSQSSSTFSRSNSTKFKFGFGKPFQNEKSVNMNGFTSFPPPFTQVLPPVIFISLVIQIMILSINYLGELEIYIISGILGIILIPTIYFWYLTTSIQPTDLIQLQHLEYIKNPKCSNFDPKKYKYFCNLCRTCIGQKSFHCNKCNRCVEYFDHHCKWLNNCIGSKNYVEFIKLVVLSELVMIYFYIVNTKVLIKIIGEYQHFPALFWYSISSIGISIAPFVAISMLLSLHLYLIIAKRSTIQLILESRNNNKIHLANQKPNQKLPIQIKTRRFSPLPFQSPLNTPSLLNQQQALIKYDSQDPNNQSLNKFKANLTKSLRLSKIDIKYQKQAHLDDQEDEKQNKITFKPTILKKKSIFQSTEKKKNNYLSNQKGEHSEHQGSSQENSQKQYDPGQTSKCMISKLKFSTKKQLTDQQIGQAFTERQRTDKKAITNFTCRQYNTSQKQKYPKQLSPLKSTQTQRKIKFKSNTETFDKQSINQKKLKNEECSKSNKKMTQKSSKKKSSKSKSKSVEKSQKLTQSVKSTRIVKVIGVRQNQN